jgi:hypothetical protein
MTPVRCRVALLDDVTPSRESKTRAAAQTSSGDQGGTA